MYQYLMSMTIGCTWSKKGVKIPKQGHTFLTYRSFAEFDEDSYIGDFKNAPFSDVSNHNDPDDAVNTWYSILNRIDKHAPRKMKRTNPRLNQNGSLQKYKMSCATETIFTA